MIKSFRVLLNETAGGTAPAALGVARIPVGPLLELYAAVAHDLRSFNVPLRGADPLEVVGVGLEQVVEEDMFFFVRTSVGSLRYCIDGEGRSYAVDIERLCTATGCGYQRLGRGLMTAYCRQHITTGVAGVEPLAGDERGPASEAARDHARVRLNALEGELNEEERTLGNTRMVIASIRTGLNIPQEV